MSDRNNIWNFVKFEHFEPIRHIGAGSYGEVFEVKYKKDGKHYALKANAPKTSGKQSSTFIYDNNEHELEIMSRLQHPNLLNFLSYFVETLPQNFLELIPKERDASIDFFNLNKCHIIIMPLMKSSLDNLLKSTVLSTKEWIKVYKQILSAILYLKEKKIAHIDIKEDNILISTSNDYVLSDFGLSVDCKDSWKIGDPRKYTGFCYWGNTLYMPPEVTPRSVDYERADEWSISKLIKSHLKDNNKILMKILDNMTDTDPEARYNLSDVIKSLDDLYSKTLEVYPYTLEDVSESEYKNISEMVHETIVKDKHPISVFIRSIKKYKSDHFEKQFQELKKFKNPLQKFHGTTKENMEEIFKSGFKLPDTNLRDVEGDEKTLMFGKGIYFATHFSKSDLFSQHSNMLLCDIYLENPKIMKSSNYDLDKECLENEGYDSVYAPGGNKENQGCDLEEYVIYEPKKILPRYLIEYKSFKLVRSMIYPSFTCDDHQIILDFFNSKNVEDGIKGCRLLAASCIKNKKIAQKVMELDGLKFLFNFLNPQDELLHCEALKALVNLSFDHFFMEKIPLDLFKQKPIALNSIFHLNPVILKQSLNLTKNLLYFTNLDLSHHKLMRIIHLAKTEPSPHVMENYFKEALNCLNNFCISHINLIDKNLHIFLFELFLFEPKNKKYLTDIHELLNTLLRVGPSDILKKYIIEQRFIKIFLDNLEENYNENSIKLLYTLCTYKENFQEIMDYNGLELVINLLKHHNNKLLFKILKCLKMKRYTTSHHQ